MGKRSMGLANTSINPHWQRWLKAVLIVGLGAIATLVLGPALGSGQWPWSQPMEAPGLDQLRSLTETSLPLPGWKVRSQEPVVINGQRWGLSEYVQETADEMELLGVILRPQPWHDQQPTVEWMDLRGAQNWSVADAGILRFTAAGSSVRARYFQARTDQQTYGVMQWYAWPDGGDFAPGRWFWADQHSQWRSNHRTPWVAVCLLLPISPLGDIDSHADTLVQLGKATQSALLAAGLAPPQPLS